MAIGELFLSAFIQVLFERLASRELLNFATQEGVGSKLKIWEERLVMIQAVLRDAEEKQLTDRAVKLWLDNLQDLAYDVDDILDEFATEALRRELMAKNQPGTSKVRNLIPSFFTGLRFNRSLDSKIKIFTNRLEELCKQRNELGLLPIPGRPSSAAAQQRPLSTSVPTEPAVYGRDEDKARILEMLLGDEPSHANFCVIPIVGMAGVGKTTLARIVYNDEAVEDFKPRSWVCVSDDFDVFRISKALLESIMSLPCSLNDLNEVQVQLKKALDGKKFLLVLDDVWNKNYGLWELLMSPFLSGAPGSKIIVTTRNTDVALTVGSVKCYELKGISNEDCWSVFVKHVFQRRDIDVHDMPKLIRTKVVEKCRGLPLAARTLGGLLRSKQRYDTWEDILNSNIWDLPEESGILPVLRLSYHHLPSYLKRCFAYCAIFPKDYEFEEKELVLLWMAEGVIQQVASSNRQMEDLGSQYFRDLLSRSIFQQSSSNSSKFVMHDLIHDMAQLVSGETIFRLEESGNRLKGFKRARHSSYRCGFYDGKNKFEVFHEFECLRTFLLVLMNGILSDRPLHITNTVLTELLPKFKKLRVLSFRGYYITQLPNSIGGLRHLRYLNLSGTMIKSLPESTGSLLNLQILILRDCYRLIRLPSYMRNLVNLRHLDIAGASLLIEMPLGMKELKNLQTLSNFIVGKGAGSGLKDLKNLKFLRGELCISRLENVTNLLEIGEAVLSDKKDLEALSLLWRSHEFDKPQDEVVEKNVLDMLQPHKNLKELTVGCYGGTRFPSWMGDPSFSNMVVLKLENCKNCTLLPSLGCLGLLKDLTIKGMTGIKCIGSEFYGNGCSKSFISLEILRFKNMQEWEYWDTVQGNENVERLCCLRELYVLKCPKLCGKLPDHLPSLKTLVISECAELEVSFSSFPILDKLEIDECKGLVCSSLAKSKSLKSMTLSNISECGDWSQHEFQKVECLRIVDCEELINLWQKEICLEKPLQGLQSLISLRELCIENCTSLISFPEANILSTLTELVILNCGALKSLPEGIKHKNAHLERLQIKGCHSLTFIGGDQLPSSLIEVDISNCEKLQCLFHDEEYVCNSSLPSSSAMTHKENVCKTSLLMFLSISNCPSLMCISSSGQLPLALKYLQVRGCSEIATLSSRSCLPEKLQSLKIGNCLKLESIAEKFSSYSCLRNIYLSSCQSLKSIPDGLHNLSHLQRIEIQNCPSLVSFPEGGLPNTKLIVAIDSCEKLEALPNHLYGLNSLQVLKIKQCPSIQFFPEEGFPTNLTTLSIKDLKIYKALIEWGLHKLTSLKHLHIAGCYAMFFPEEEMGMMLPASLTWLGIDDFPKLKYLSSNGLQSLTSLELLWISNCPKLASFPETGLPSSLLGLKIINCPLLKKQCKRNKGQEWPKIAHIPCVDIDGIFIYDEEEQE